MFGLLLVAALSPPDPTKSAPAALTGEWRLVSTSDASRTDAGSDAVRMTVDERGRVKFTFGPVETNRGAFTPASSSGELKFVDLKTADGNTFQGVYSLEGDTLVLCFDEAGKDRPAGLKPTGTQWAERWARLGR